MIEVNLLPGGKKRSTRRPRLSFSLPNIKGGLPTVNRWTLAATLASLVAVLGSAFFFFSISGDLEEIEVQTELAVRDSIQLGDVMAESSLLQARADSVAERVAVIQNIDQNRYVWPHIMDEVARAMPDYAWLTGLFQVFGGDELVFQVQGQAGTYFALTTFMENLEASPFISGVQLIESQQVSISGGDVGGERLLYQFTLEALATDAPPELIETVPLFGPSVSSPQATRDG